MIRPVIEIAKEKGLKITGPIDINELEQYDIPLFVDCALCRERVMSFNCVFDTDTSDYVCVECCERVYKLEVSVDPN